MLGQSWSFRPFHGSANDLIEYLAVYALVLLTRIWCLGDLVIGWTCCFHCWWVRRAECPFVAFCWSETFTWMKDLCLKTSVPTLICFSSLLTFFAFYSGNDVGLSCWSVWHWLYIKKEFTLLILGGKTIYGRLLVLLFFLLFYVHSINSRKHNFWDASGFVVGHLSFTTQTKIQLQSCEDIWLKLP